SFFHDTATPPPLPLFPTRRSSDLVGICVREKPPLHLFECIALACRRRQANHHLVLRQLLPLRLPLLIGALHLRHKTNVRINFLRSEEHTSELQSLTNLVCRLLLQK